jgi:hypothetical protein
VDPTAPWQRVIIQNAQSMPESVFLSYNHQDRDAVTRISSTLKQSAAFFIDQDNLAPGLPWARS